MSQTAVECTAAPHAERQTGNRTQALQRIEDALCDLRFGEVTVVVQDGFVVQVERTEKVRLQR